MPKNNTIKLFDIPGVIQVELEQGPILPLGTLAKMLSIGRRRLYRWAVNGNMKCVKIWGQWFAQLSQPVTLRKRKIMLTSILMTGNDSRHNQRKNGENISY